MLCSRLLVCVIVAGGAMTSVARAQIPAAFSNLQVFPKDIPRAELVAAMRGITTGLGVRCTYCHVGPDDLTGMNFATDEKRTKQVARTMLRMVRSINTDYIATIPAGEAPRQAVTCMTCHRKSAIPTLAAPTGSAPGSNAPRPITGAEAKNFVGNEVTVCGLVASARRDVSIDRKPAFLNLDKPFPDQSITVVIFEEQRVLFGEPEERYRGKNICATGVVEQVPGQPGLIRIVATKPEQIKEK
jgi:hypothetical protein